METIGILARWALAIFFICRFVDGWKDDNLQFDINDIVFDEGSNRALRLYVRTLIEEQTGEDLRDYPVGYNIGNLRSWVVADLKWGKRKIIHSIVFTEENFEKIVKELEG